MLKTFSVQNYRNLKVRDMKFDKINIVVGPNNSGKSNLIDALNFFANLVSSEGKDSAFHSMLMRRGWSEIADRYSTVPNRVSMSWTLGTNTEMPDLVYDLEFAVGTNSQIPQGFFITKEALRNAEPFADQYNRPFEFFVCHDPEPGKGRFSVKPIGKRNGTKARTLKLDVQPTDSVFRQIEVLLNSKPFREELYPNFIRTVKTIRDYFERFRSYASTQFDVQLIRQPVKLDMNARFLDRNAANYANVLAYLDRNNPRFLDDFTLKIRRLIPEVDKIRVIPVSDTTITVELIISGKVFKLHEMSDGTIKILVMALLLHTPERMSLLTIDEPELNLHPAWLRVISEWIVRCSSADQVFISTHSPDLLDGLTEQFRQGGLGLFVTSLDRDETVKRITVDMLNEKFEEGWELGDLYRVGDPKLGGWPW
jgi:predicted ATPase